jgi:hypothetical protein
MSSNLNDDPIPQDDPTIPSSARRTAQMKPPESSLGDMQRLQGDAPWLLRRFYEEQIDLAAELGSRFAGLPLMSVIRFRVLDAGSGRGMAVMATADGTASVLIEADPVARMTHLAFTYGSMLTLRFHLDKLTSRDRAHWLEQMTRQQDSLAFLWGQARWEQDYLICATRRNFVNLYAFSHNGFEAAIRLTPDIKMQLLSWLETTWKTDTASEDSGKLLTW